MSLLKLFKSGVTKLTSTKSYTNYKDLEINFSPIVRFAQNNVNQNNDYYLTNPLPFGKLIGTKESNFVYIYRNLPFKKVTPNFNLIESINFDPSAVTLLTTCRKTEDLSLRKILFLDIETTGLSPTPDEHVILIGLGFFTQTKFHIEQFFMRDLRDEISMLNSFLERLKYFTHIVGYNVKAFDYNYLKKKLLYYDITLDDENLDFIDLRVASRRFFKHRFENYRLSYIEEVLLGRARNDDIQGSQVPEYWHRFLETKDNKYAIKIIEHNLHDIISTFYLFLWFFLRFRKPYLCYFSSIHDKISLLELLEKHRRFDDLSESLNYLSKYETNSETKKILMERFSKYIRH